MPACITSLESNFFLDPLNYKRKLVLICGITDKRWKVATGRASSPNDADV